MQTHVNSYYAATRNYTGDFPVLEESVDCDVCVIGAGYTGLSSALFLAEAGYSVTVLEAAKVGFGASGRNGGQLVNSYSRDVDVIEQRYGEKSAEILGSMMFEGADIIRQRIQHYDIQCDYRQGGIFAALNKKQFKGLAEQKSSWERYGNRNLQLLDAKDMAREVGCENYVGGLLDKQGGHVHPLNLALGEASAIIGLGGRIFEQSAAENITYGEPNVVRTAKGVVRAKYLLIAGNAYLPQNLDPRVTRKSMPCGSQIVVTEPLSEKVARSLITHNYCVEDCNYLLDYYRLTADNRLLYGGGVVYGAREPHDIEQLIRPKILKTFPQLKNVKIDYRWTGNFLLTMSRMPQFGRIEKNAYYMQGYSGHGVTCSHLAGKLISEVIRGDAERFDAFASLPHMPMFGGRTFQAPLTAMGAAYYALRDRFGI
ncbi:FAD-binding oxidoreductase [Pseudomonas extremaustralis]|jgi:gamma-glutamylputrescine oxidase|uniref:FAD-binding oxidoreductase n=1 Tax=Pseudomonas extremaustralis TaxID=359110 RepID=A0A5C5QR04_9PSED|nr:FAD-binding oxidoreductase [Pseudomonas extremaustralis]EZI30253.1 gamma-glutamylputrescine oxidoreductase [Pseudomonas extremaustralis 14-3 substr. 14-3b]MDB1112536.1 FAD-binding oxidoreductase [Pseudomonas extremaustralis]MDF3136194.1 FAD-binding oxidoreductase [Pseudomonas extremaustralis]MDG2965445.1 FAD-binding oxidoreductase [Pseudomonas extremaustralis]TWS07538.1 FAD-binding oxidoreductase [Pseudomonas extremaustralis]